MLLCITPKGDETLAINQFNVQKKCAIDMDKDDSLKKYRDEFYLPEDKAYYEGNGLGPLCRSAESSLNRLIEEWKTYMCNGWMAGEIPWFFYPERLAATQSQIVGADKDEIIINASTTANIHSVISTFYKPRGDRKKILIDELNFPSDRYAVESQILLKDLIPEECIEVIKSRDGWTIEEEDIIAAMNEDVALIFLPSVLHLSGQLLDMEYLAKESNKRDILIGFDCSHSIGVVPHELSKWGVDFAVWCNYKYLNGGVGCPASIYINNKHFDKMPGMAGWHGYKKSKQFDMRPYFEPAGTAGGWQIGSPHIINMAPLEGAMKILNEAGIDNIREKSIKMTKYYINLVKLDLEKFGFEIITPLDEDRRGGHVTIVHPAGKYINEYFENGFKLTDEIKHGLKNAWKIEDGHYRFSKKYMIRLSFSPLYNSYMEIWNVVEKIKLLFKE